jgi:hypothetical protein
MERGILWHSAKGNIKGATFDIPLTWVIVFLFITFHLIGKTSFLTGGFSSKIRI